MRRPRRRNVRVDEESVPELACACATARRVARLLTQFYDRHLRSAGLEAPQYALLATLDAHGPCTQTVLGRQHGLDKTTVSRHVSKLRRDGWITRSPTLDRRERRIGLTAEGRAKFTNAKPHWLQAQRTLQGALSARQWREMFSALQTVGRAADALRDETI